MGIISSVQTWASDSLASVIKIVKKGAEIAHKAASVVEALLEGKDIILEEDDSDKRSKTKNNRERPDVMADFDSSKSTEIDELKKSINENNQKLTGIEKVNDLDHRRIQLQIDLMELVVSSSVFERFSNNINLHASNLQIHLQTIQNTSGLLDSVNRQRVAIKALMKTVNLMIYELNIGDKVRKIEGLDIDWRPGSISINKACDAFENTRDLLTNEIDSFLDAISEQIERIDRVKAAAKCVPDKSLKIQSWISNSVEPSMEDARIIATELNKQLKAIPRLERNIRTELDSINTENL